MGGTGNWNATAGTKWATTSGGAGGAAIPNSSDDVFFDANSGSVTVTKTNTSDCNNLDLSGFTGTLAGSSGIGVFGNLTFGSGNTITLDGTITLKSTSAGNTITSNGVSLPCNLTFNGVGGEWTLQDNLNIPQSNNKTLTVSNGTFNSNEKTITVRYFNSNSGTTRAIDISNSTLNVLGVGFSPSTNLTLTSTGSDIDCSGGGGFEFYGGDLVFNNLTYNTSSTFRIEGNNTFNTVSFAPSGAATITFLSGSTQTMTTLNVSGAGLGVPLSLVSSTPGSSFSLSQSSGTVAGNFLKITDSSATGGATFIARHSYDNGGNSGWNFENGDMFSVF